MVKVLAGGYRPEDGPTTITYEGSTAHSADPLLPSENK
jgi:hypothetical protein